LFSLNLVKIYGWKSQSKASWKIDTLRFNKERKLIKNTKNLVKVAPKKLKMVVFKFRRKI